MSVWTKEKVNQLKEMWADPTLSLSDMAERLGFETRNMIAGKAYRIGLALRRQPNSRRGQRAAANRPTTKLVIVNVRRRRARTPICAPVEIIPANAPEHLGLTLLQTDNTTCKYPRGDEWFTFCGHSVQPDSSYCPFHHQLCYRPPERREPPTFRRAA
jgi:hypothetical protein